MIAAGSTVYGVNTGFGLLARTRIDDARLAELQRALVRSHSAGTGALLDDAVGAPRRSRSRPRRSRAATRACAAEVIDTLFAVVNAGIVPCIPAQGSVGASGDLAPLAHLAAVLIGEGEAPGRRPRTARRARRSRRAGSRRSTSAPKEGLALLNGTQVSTALALRGLFAAERALRGAFVAGALTRRRLPGQRHAVRRAHPRRARPSRPDATRRASIARCWQAARIRASHVDCHRVQDPYSLRCQPQVMGACLDQLRHAARRAADRGERGVRQSAGVRASDDEILSGGNFHAEPVAFAADNLALAIAEIGALSERRIALLMDTDLSGLPPFLVEDGGVNSGFMIAQVTAAALASENKALAHPASVDSLPTSANQEDHVSMATNAARRLLPMAGNTAAIVAIELLAAAQGVDMRRPLDDLAGRCADAHRARSATSPRSGTGTAPSRRTSPRCARSVEARRVRAVRRADRLRAALESRTARRRRMHRDDPACAARCRRHPLLRPRRSARRAAPRAPRRAGSPRRRCAC